MDAIDAGICTVVIADELSRLTRTSGEGSRPIVVVSEQGLNVIVSDGVASNREGWKDI